MLSLRAFLALAAFSLLASLSPAADVPDRQTLEKAIPYAISLLEAKNYKGFLESFVPPEELKEITSEVSLDQMARGFAQKKAESMVKSLKLIQGSKPKLAQKGTVATYPLPGEGVAGKREINFTRIGKNWYITD